MLLEEAIEKHKSAVRLLEGFSHPGDKNREDDIFVRPYIVRAHWRIRVIRRKTTGRAHENSARP